VYFFAQGTIHNPAELGVLQAAETEVLRALKAEGTVLAAFRKPTGGIVSFVHGDSEASVRARMATLPFVAHGLLTFEYAEVIDL
jgi:hypothetical protein